MAEIQLSGINKIYPGGTHAVHDVDLHIRDGEFMIMVGPSGCAKSTILRMVAGLETPTSGTVSIGGRVVNDVAPKDRDIAMVFQSYALYPHMTVRDNMAFGLRLRNMTEQQISARVGDAARVLGLEHMLDRLPKQMSGGQRQRVAMGRAIVREPQAFLMDEPLSNLDAKLRVQMRTEIAKLHQRLNTTTMYVTHDQVEAMTLGQRICILRLGVVQQVAAPWEVYANPANVFVAGFMGSPSMNFLDGTIVTDAQGQPSVQLGDSTLQLPPSILHRLSSENVSNGKPVIVGIRPEHLSLTAPDDPASISATIDLIESMGSESFAYFTSTVSSPDLSMLSDTQATANTFIAKLDDGHGCTSGNTYRLALDVEHLQLFDAQSHGNLLAPVTQQHNSRIEVAQPAQAHDPFATIAPQQQSTQTPAPMVDIFNQPIAPAIHLETLEPEELPAPPAPASEPMQQPAAAKAFAARPVVPPKPAVAPDTQTKSQATAPTEPHDAADQSAINETPHNVKPSGLASAFRGALSGTSPTSAQIAPRELSSKTYPAREQAADVEKPAGLENMPPLRLRK